MPTKNPRINITFEEITAKMLEQLAQREHKSVASMAKELIIEALERREDIALSRLAEIRDTINAKRLTHDEIWK